MASPHPDEGMPAARQNVTVNGVRWTRLARSIPWILMLVLLAACGDGGGGEGGERPSLSPTVSRSLSPTRTLDPTETATETSTATETATQTATATATLTETSTATPEPTPTASESPGGSESAPQDNPDDSIPSWVWWLLAALVLALAVAIPLVVRARRRGGWRADLRAAEAEVAWFARELLPELRRVGTREQVAGGWAVGSTRVAAAEDGLTGLAATTRTAADRARAESLRDAVRRARGRMDHLVAPGQRDTWALDLDGIIVDLESALGPVRSPG
jgi:hypothetical protein